jgi:hypothetical protein
VARQNVGRGPDVGDGVVVDDEGGVLDDAVAARTLSWSFRPWTGYQFTVDAVYFAAARTRTAWGRAASP